MKVPNIPGYNPAVISRVLDMLDGTHPEYKVMRQKGYLSLIDNQPCGCARGAILYDMYKCGKIQTLGEVYLPWRVTEEAEHSGLPPRIVVLMETIFEGRVSYCHCSKEYKSTEAGKSRFKHRGDGKRVARFLRRCLKISEPVQAVPQQVTVAMETVEA